MDWRPHLHQNQPITIRSISMSILQDNYQVIAETYPNIAKKIKLTWGTQGLTDLVHELVNNTRDHGREGFPMKVLASLFKVQEVHDHVFPSLSEPTVDARASTYGLSAFGNL